MKEREWSIVPEAGEGRVWKGFPGEARLEYMISKPVNSPCVAIRKTTQEQVYLFPIFPGIEV